MNDIKKQGSFTIVVDRIGTGTDAIPFQLFGALDGVHKTAQTRGGLINFIPEQFRGTSTATTTARFQPDGSLEILDTATGNGVSIQANKIPYQSLLEFIKAQCKPEETALVIANTKLTYSTETSRSEQLTVRDRSYFEELKDTNYDIEDYFEPDQEQSLVLNIPEIINITPATKIDSDMVADENRLTFTFTMQVV